MPSVDLNSDLGEGFGTYRCGDDEAMLAIVTSANVACGLHAGDPEVMARTFGICRATSTTIENRCAASEGPSPRDAAFCQNSRSLWWKSAPFCRQNQGEHS